MFESNLNVDYLQYWWLIWKNKRNKKNDSLKYDYIF